MTPDHRTPVRIRLAEPGDGAAAAEIYRPAVETSVASFELEAPTAAEMAERIRRTLVRTPWLVAIDGGLVVGYAYASAHGERAGYRWSVDVSGYVHADRRGQGIGSALYGPLFEVLRAQRFVNVYAGITPPNDQSMWLHQRFGMEPIGVYRTVGYKFGQWHDVAWFGVRLQEPTDPPEEPIPLAEFLTSSAGQAWLDRMAARTA